MTPLLNHEAQSLTACSDCIALGMLAADNIELTAVCAGFAGVTSTGVSVEDDDENLLRLGGDASYSSVGASDVVCFGFGSNGRTGDGFTRLALALAAFKVTISCFSVAFMASSSLSAFNKLSF